MEGLWRRRARPCAFHWDIIPIRILIIILIIIISLVLNKMKVWTFLQCLAILLVLCVGSDCGTVLRRTRSKRELVKIREAKAVFPGACATRLPRGKRSLPALDRRLPRQRRRSSPAEDASSSRGKAVYFTGRGDQLRLKPGVDIPKGNFTLQMWVKAEGGQRSPTVIAGRNRSKRFTRVYVRWMLVEE